MYITTDVSNEGSEYSPFLMLNEHIRFTFVIIEGIIHDFVFFFM